MNYRMVLEANAHAQADDAIAGRPTARAEVELTRSRRRLQEKRRGHIADRHAFVSPIQDVRCIDPEVD